MKIVLLNKWDVIGGAARAAFRLYQGLREKGHTVDFFVQDKQSDEKHIHQIESFDHGYAYLERQVQRYYINVNRSTISDTYFSYSYSGFNVVNNAIYNHADVVNLHWVEKFISPQTLVQLVALNKPLVWTLHDERAFTGGCHYTAGCKEFMLACGQCIQLRYDPFKLPSSALEAKSLALRGADLTIVSPSQWLADEARKSKLFKNKRIEVIPNSLETDIFAPIPKSQAKESLAIDASKVTLMFGAEDNKERRKGLDDLIRALRLCLQNDRFLKACRMEDIIIISVGSRGKEIKELPIKLKAFGKIDDDRKMSELYNATDIFVLPSLEDNLPNMMLEAMACGTPVIGFNTGGIPDVVKHRENGLVVEKGNAKALSEAILELVFDENKRNKFSQNCRIKVETNFTLADQAENYQKLFEQLHSRAGEKKKPPQVIPEDLNRLFDPVAGYSIRKALGSGENTEIPCATNNDNKYASPLQEAVKQYHYFRLLKQPVSKFRALKKILSFAFCNKSNNLD